eukprot:2982074-Pleurochrysis_carterae.AAC.1
MHVRVGDYGGRTAAQLSVGRDVGEDGVLVRAQVVDNVRAELENLAKHVARAAREAAPVGKDDERQVLGVVEVGNRLRRLESRVGVPDLPRLCEHRLARVGVGGVGGDALLHEARLHSDDAHGHAAELGAADDDRLAP